jgi:hypothetical protein
VAHGLCDGRVVSCGVPRRLRVCGGARGLCVYLVWPGREGFRGFVVGCGGLAALGLDFVAFCAVAHVLCDGTVR